jgi:hypothetical protein
VVDEDALYDALTSDRIRGARLDVMVDEPPASEHKLFTLQNVILTPHLAGPSWENWKKAFRNSFDNIERVARGEKPLWVIPELRGRAGASIFRSPRLRQAERRHLLATQDFCGRVDNFGGEGRGPECDPFGERFDHRLRQSDAGEPFVLGRDDVPWCGGGRRQREQVVECREVITPVRPVADVLGAHFPMLGRGRDPLAETPELLRV